MRFAALGSVAASTLISRLTPAARPGRFGRERFFRPCGDFSRIEEAPAIRLLSTVSKSVATGTDYVGPYRLIRQLNSGLRMQVWEAKKDGDPERVVVKAINDRFRNDKEQLQHLKHEYEVGKELRNPHVIEIRELHTSGEIAYLVMEYFDALNLKQHLWQGEMWVTLQLPPIIENMAKGLEYLHRKGWVHRDIKPDNYLVAPDGMAKLIDFSLAVKIKRGRGLGTLLVRAADLRTRSPLAGTGTHGRRPPGDGERDPAAAPRTGRRDQAGLRSSGSLADRPGRPAQGPPLHGRLPVAGLRRVRRAARRPALRRRPGHPDRVRQAGPVQGLVVGHQKGKTYKERAACYFGCAHPEGYRKAMAKMRLAAKYGLPVIAFIDTPGAYPGVGAEERGQAWVIAENMYEMSRLPTPIICVVIGEGGSGGALGIGVGDRVAMLQHAYYSVISPRRLRGHSLEEPSKTPIPCVRRISASSPALDSSKPGCRARFTPVLPTWRSKLSLPAIRPRKWMTRRVPGWRPERGSSGTCSRSRGSSRSTAPRATSKF
jgi:hypothetical protein